MILRDRPTGLMLFFVLRGSIMPRIRNVLLFNIALATAVTITHGTLFQFKVTLTAIPFTLMGLPLAIFLGFRNTAAYDRYWEARKLWGELVTRCRDLARQCLSLLDGPAPEVGPVTRRLLLRGVAFCHALRVQLRRSTDSAALQALLDPAEWQALARASNRPEALLRHMGAELAQCRRRGWIDSLCSTHIDRTLSALNAAAAGCERIAHTPLPFSYTLLLHRTAYVYCLLLPFGIVDTTGVLTPLVVGVVAFTFFGLDALGDELEEPFGTEANDLPLDALCRGIEIQMREALGETDLPPALEPVDYCLL
jgi:putative membrane protein